MADVVIREVRHAFEDGDRFNRIEFRRLVERIIRSIEGPFVININGDWGKGKSYLLKMLLENRENEYIYINTYENDYYDEPFTAIAGEIISYINKKNPETDLAKTVVGNVKELARIVAKNALPLLIKAGIKALAGDKASDKVVEAFEASLNEYGTSLIDNHEERKKGMNELKKSLSKYVEGRKLVFLIDELDRCKPDYAMEFLELLKHLFDIQGIIFVIATATNRLATSVQSFYGVQNGHLYLKKFFNVTLDLPEYSSREYTEKRLKDNVTIWKKKLQTSEIDVIIKEISQMCEDTRIDIRTIEECLNSFFIGSLISDKQYPASLYIFSFYLIMLHATNLDKFDEYRLNPEAGMQEQSIHLSFRSDSVHLVKCLWSLQLSISFDEYYSTVQKDGVYIAGRILDELIVNEIENSEIDRFLAAKKRLERFIREFQLF